jgi:hypothetical protein
LILALEQGLRELIRRFANDTWRTRLSESRLTKAEEVLASRRGRNVDIDLVECLQLADLFDVAAKEHEISDRLGMAKKSVISFKKEVVEARDAMAHGGSLLSIHDDPLEAIGLLMEIRLVAEQIWVFALEIDGHWADRE